MALAKRIRHGPPTPGKKAGAMNVRVAVHLQRLLAAIRKATTTFRSLKDPPS